MLSKGGISSSSSSHGQSALPIFSLTRPGREFGGIFDCVALDVAKAASVNTVRESVVAFDRLLGVGFLLL